MLLITTPDRVIIEHKSDLLVIDKVTLVAKFSLIRTEYSHGHIETCFGRGECLSSLYDPKQDTYGVTGILEDWEIILDDGIEVTKEFLEFVIREEKIDVQCG